MDKGKVLPIWQEIGYSTNQLALDAFNKYGQKTTHTGTLDPMAEGVVVLLIGNERFNKSIHSEGKKTYEFEIFQGISTDSFDGMGLVTKENFEKQVDNERLIKNVLKSFVGKYTQEVPIYSSIRYKGKLLHQHAQNKEFVIDTMPMKNGEIYKIKLLGIRKRRAHSVISELITKIEGVRVGEFRQTRIIRNWKNFVKNTQNILIPIIKIEVQMSRGLYVRSLSQDICRKLNTLGFVSSLVRTKNGKYNRQNCKEL